MLKRAFLTVALVVAVPISVVGCLVLDPEREPVAFGGELITILVGFTNTARRNVAVDAHSIIGPGAAQYAVFSNRCIGESPIRERARCFIEVRLVRVGGLNGWLLVRFEERNIGEVKLAP